MGLNNEKEKKDWQVVSVPSVISVNNVDEAVKNITTR